jgi:hypothetical protein
MFDGFGNVPARSTTQSTKPTLSIQTTQTAQSNRDPGLTTASKVGIAVALIGGILLGLLGALGIYYCRKKKKSKAKASDPVQWVEGGNAAAQVLETRRCESSSSSSYFFWLHCRALIAILAGGISPFASTAGGVQTRPGDFRKERRLNGEKYRAPSMPGEPDGYFATISGRTSGITSARLPPSTPSVISAHPPPYVS